MWYLLLHYSDLSGLVAEKGGKSHCFQPRSLVCGVHFVTFVESVQIQAFRLSYRRLISPISPQYLLSTELFSVPRMIEFKLIQVIRETRNPFCPFLWLTAQKVPDPRYNAVDLFPQLRRLLVSTYALTE